MSEEDKGKGGKQEEGKKVDPAAEPKNTEGEGEGEPGPIPYHRFKEVNDQAKALTTRLAELEKKQTEAESAQEEARQAKLKEQAKFEELANEWERKYTELQPQSKAAEEELVSVKAVLEKYAATQLEAVPELYRSVVEKLPLTERLDWLSENADKFVDKKPSGVPATPKGSGSGEMTDDERRRLSARTF